MWRDSICAKLAQIGRPDLANPLDECHRERSVRLCVGCRGARVFWNRCELKHCPICAERLANERRKAVEWWLHEIKQPKHVVLTARNTEDFCEAYLKWFKDQFGKLRRSKLAKNWRGGMYSIEVTWKREGAHVHLHALIDAHWIDAAALARKWGELMGQDFAIVKVKDARDRSYLGEVAKYVVKGSEMATWQPERVARFIDAISNVRMFGVFGTLYGKRTELKEWLDTIREMRNVCDCGCRQFRILDEQSYEWEQVTRELAIPPPPTRPAPDRQLGLV